MSDEGDYGFEIDVPVRNEWANVKLLVMSVQNCFNAMFGNLDGSETVAMVTGELLENAIKYGTWTSGGHRLRLKVSGKGTTAIICVDNPAEPAGVRELMRTLEWIKEFPSPDAAYRARLLAIAQTPDPDVSQLGLVRIAYEGRCSLTAQTIPEGIRVTAEVQL